MMTRNRRTMLGLAIAALGACAGSSPPSPPESCATAWAEPDVRDFVESLLYSTGTDREVWGTYSLGDGWYVVHAGPSTDGNACLGVFANGETVAYASLPEEPALLTPLYGYYFETGWLGGSDAEIVDRSRQPLPIQSWLEDLGVPSAVVMPVTVPDFPIEIPTIVKTQLAIHEAFHVVEQGPTWWAGTGEWPAWDRQPDRAGARVCYTTTPAVAGAFTEERSALVGLVVALLEGDSAQACEAGSEFLSLRNDRYSMLEGVVVTRAEGTPGTCEGAEALLELEEGTADYASWTVLHGLGQVTQQRLLQRYEATQNDVFYLTGAMQLHAIEAMSADSMIEVTKRINASSGPDTGSITSVLARTLGGFCQP